MKALFHAYAMCQSMFCAIPFPGKIWDDDARGKMLLFLPVVGLEIGALWAGLLWLCRYFALPDLVTGALLCGYPFLITGFIHLDGFMDVTDAVKSWRDLERRREILKDSHVGSFSVIGLGLLLIAQFALCASIKKETPVLVLLLIPVVSRCCSGLAVSLLPSMHTSQYADQKKPLGNSAVLALMLAASLAAGFVFWGRYGFALVGGLIGHGLALGRAYRSLEGMNGDISGYALTYSELAALAVTVLI